MLNKILIIVLLFITQNVFAQFAGGTGSSVNPFLVETLSQLNSIRSYSSSYYFKQIADIDASSGITPIDFQAHYDGDGHTISGFTYNNSSADHVALFSYLRSGAEIKNLGITNVNIYGYYNTGGLVSYNSGGTITNCYVTGNVHGNNSRVGGLVAENTSTGTITNCYSTATVWTNAGSYNNVGGLVGQNNGTISRSFSTGNVTGGNPYSSCVGGLVGQNYSGASIDNCYSTGIVYGYYNTGGFVGDNRGSISNCYSKGSVSGYSSPRGFCGSSTDGSTNNSFWDTQTSGRTTSNGGTPKNSAEMITRSTFETAGWDFTVSPVWAISNSYNNGYPILVGVTPTPPPPVVITTQPATSIRSYTAILNGTVNPKTISTVVRFLYGTSAGVYTDSVTATPSPISDNTDIPVSGNITGLTRGGTYYFTISTSSTAGYYRGPERSFTTTTQFSGGAGTSENPYLIGDVNDLQAIGGLSTSNTYYFEQIANIDASATSGWNSGGGFLPLTQLYSNYDGKNYSITGLVINYSSTAQRALFVSLSSGRYIKNLNLVNVQIHGRNYVAGLVYANHGTISNCSVSGFISGHNNDDVNAAGLVSTNESDGVIERCYSTATITNSNTSAFNLGGFVSHNSGSITNCYSTGNVGSCNNNGGFVSFNNPGGTITNCYSCGAVTGGSTNRGFAYYNGGTITNCFWDNTENPNAYFNNGQGTGVSTALMKIQSTFSSWDISVWNMDSEINNGYPYLDWQNPGGNPLPVELTSFTANAIDNGVELKWETATEVNNYGFQVERLSVISYQSSVITNNPNSDVQIPQWDVVGFVEGNGNSNSPKQYSFVDTNPPAGNLQYRLKQIDTDGQFQYYSNIAEVVYSLTDVIEKQLPTEFALNQNYPNPFNPVTNLGFQIAECGLVVLKVFDVLGNEVTTLVNEEKAPGYYNVKFDGNNLSSGVYIYRLTAGSFTSTKKLLLMK